MPNISVKPPGAPSVYPAGQGGYTLASWGRTVVIADIDSADTDDIVFPEITTGGLLVTASASTTLTVRLQWDTEDVSIPVLPGVLNHLPLRCHAVRQSSFADILSVTGLFV